MKNRLLQSWQILSLREKLLGFVLLAIVLPLMTVQFALLPLVRAAENAYLSSKQSLAQIKRLDQNIASLNDLNAKNSAAGGFSFEGTLTELLDKSGVDQQPNINQEQSASYGNSYILNFDALRTDQIFRLVYNFENNQPPIIIDKLETSQSIQQENAASLTLILKTE